MHLRFDRFTMLSFLTAAIVLSALPKQSRATITLGVQSSGARFSPGNWVGDSGRNGGKFRRTWCNGAWCEFRWTTPAEHPAATLLLRNTTAGGHLAFFVDGTLTENILAPATDGIPIPSLLSPGEHTLRVYTASSEQKDRWDETNGFIVSGLVVDDGSTSLPALSKRPWVLIIGDSITEGIGCNSSLGDYAFLVGQGLDRHGYDTGVSACGYSGWIHTGDATRDVPGYYAVKNGVYSEKDSRWNKLDANTTFLDSAGHLSGYGDTGQEPSLIVFNYIVNETLNGMSTSDVQASITGSLDALREAAPKTKILVFIPPGLQDARIYPTGPVYIAALRAGVSGYQDAHPADKDVQLVDLGPAVAHALGSKAYGGGIHPNDSGHAYQAPLFLEKILTTLPGTP